LYQRGICLPSGSSLVEDDVDRVVSCMLELGRR
jgi:dTDP-4-amino-4,6-dideoxygalactose transaminase